MASDSPKMALKSFGALCGKVSLGGSYPLGRYGVTMEGLVPRPASDNSVLAREFCGNGDTVKFKFIIPKFANLKILNRPGQRSFPGSDLGVAEPHPNRRWGVLGGR